MSSDTAVEVVNVGKMYPIFKEPADRLKQMIVPRLQRAAGRPPTVYYRPFWALHDVSFRVGRGETVGIVGRNGSGKSTLLQIVSGTMAPTSGCVTVDGRLSALLELGTGFNPDFTGRENVILNGQLKGFSRREMEQRFGEIAAFADIGEFVEQPVKTYSTGMLVRLAFAVHAVLDPDVLIVDEALAVGDVRFQIKCFDRLTELKKRGTSILFVSHDTGAVRRFCDSAVWLDKGRVVEHGDVFKVTAGFTAFMLGGAPAGIGSSALPADPSPSMPGAIVPVPVPDGADVGSERATGDDAHAFAARFPYPPPGSRPVSRWGSHAPLIVSVALTDLEENGLPEIPSGAPFLVHVVADLPETLRQEGLSIGFGIRSIAGHDIIIRSTFDAKDDARNLTRGRRVRAVFEIAGILASGDYRLAVAVEDRSAAAPAYYDFIEGALVFKVQPGPHLWGVVTPPVPIRTLIDAR